MIWVYLGPPDKLPHFPEYRWLQLYPTQSAAFKLLEECNYAQALEGGLDLAHAPILHRYSPWSVRSADLRQQNLAPRHEVRDTPYGLQAYVESADRAHAHRVAERLDCGRVTINGAPHAPLAPFGGFKQSGIGREYGRYGLEAHLEVRAILG